MKTATIARLKITLNHIKPKVLRRIEVPFDIRLDQLHLALQAAMGWTNSHLYELRIGGVGFSALHPDDGGEFLDASKAKLGKVLEDAEARTFVYLYDFGDGWDHKITVERLVDPEPGVLYPRLIEVTGACPPEDCGGPWGYTELREALKDPGHERHAELKEWLGDDFDLDDDAAKWLTDDVADLAKKMSRKPADSKTKRR